MIRKHGAPTQPVFTMAFILLGGLGLAVATQHALCESDDPWHLIMCEVDPTVWTKKALELVNWSSGSHTRYGVPGVNLSLN
jgi:hypothetical protein